jgi:putative methylase
VKPYQCCTWRFLIPHGLTVRAGPVEKTVGESQTGISAVDRYETDEHLTTEPKYTVMGSKRELARRLANVEDFEEPQANLEQYATPADVAAHLVHFADLQEDIENQTVLDLGTGTGILAIAAGLRGASTIIGLDLDRDALIQARANERRLGIPGAVDWVRGDATRSPLHGSDVTVVMNPPFGAQTGKDHLDRRFLETTAEVADVSYSIHNAGSREFIEAFVADHAGLVTHAFEVRFDVPHRFQYHDESRKELTVEAYRIEWARSMG